MFEKNNKADLRRREEVRDRLLSAAAHGAETVLQKLGSGEDGMASREVFAARERYGANIVSRGGGQSLPRRICGAFINPFTAILSVLAVVSAFTDIIFAEEGEKNFATVIIIAVMVMISGLLRLVQETRSGNAAARLSGMIRTEVRVIREGKLEEIPQEDLVVGDLVVLSAGDMIPADVCVLSAKDLFVSQSALTGESEPVEKTAGPSDGGSVMDMPNLAFMGSNVVSGSARAAVLAVGGDTLLGGMAQGLAAKPEKTSFEKGINSVSWVLIRFMLTMVPIVLLVNGFTKGSWMNAALFAISVAVGLTPEMLPMIVTASLARGAVAMGQKKVIIKNLNAIQNLGSVDILCTDKTGTLTQDQVVLECHLDIRGNEDARVLRHAYLNSYYQTGLKNLIDLAIIEKQEEIGGGRSVNDYVKVDEVPFDFNRRRMSVVVYDRSGKTQMITKGAVEEMLKCCAFAEYGDRVVPLTEEMQAFVLKRSSELGGEGMRVIAVAQKTDPSPIGEFSAADERDMVLIGFLAFLDPPKKTAAEAVQALGEHGVAVKVLTGDNERVTSCICSQVGLDTGRILLGSDLDAVDDGELARLAEPAAVFAKLSPDQKARVVRILRENGHVVGFLGDGINDAAAMKAADVGISVDTAVDIAKESADVILLEKDLTVLEDGVLEGRRTYANMIKYIKMTASSNFGNMFSVLAASAFLPFLPMESIHLILLNLIYDISCTAIPWDNVDREYLKIPRRWDPSSVGRFMLWIGPASSVFDITTFLLMYFVICPAVCGGLLFHQVSDPAVQSLYIATFQAGWFIESMWSQTLVIHMIRTPKLPFIQSRASAPVTLLTFAGIAALTAIPFTPAGAALGLAAPPAAYFGWLAGTVVCYMLLATALKARYVKRWGELL
ncbi:magnesium-translocating P-type ATPase [Bacilliculturomica massiliensis]|uniref:magnesium-translocating P-type ATPase n=1 Tax=Bacilliculturomica massiliensis TaxID=1917867 RepID=UPI0038BAB296